MYMSASKEALFYAGTLIRIGTMMIVTWLAYPQLEKHGSKIPTVLIGIGILILIVLATRPSLGRIVIGIVIISLAVSFLMKLMSGKNRNRVRRR